MTQILLIINRVFIIYITLSLTINNAFGCKLKYSSLSLNDLFKSKLHGSHYHSFFKDFLLGKLNSSAI